MRYFLKKIKHFLVFFAVITYILFEELIWNKIAEPIYNFLKNLGLYNLFLSYIRMSANRYIVLILFITPFIVGEILGVLSAIFAANANILLAIIVYILKIPLVIAAFGILKAGDDKLESFWWFSVSRKLVITVMEKLKSSSIYEKINQLKNYLKHKITISKSKLKELVYRTYNKLKHHN
ncbi:MAG: hypothetical protein AB7D29_06540 [Campylobacterales bacterium]